MITITLKNGVIAEFENHKEAAMFLYEMHKLNSRPVVITGNVVKYCKICKSTLPARKHSVCDKESCAKEAKRRYQRSWYKKHPNYQKDKKSSQTVPINHLS